MRDRIRRAALLVCGTGFVAVLVYLLVTGWCECLDHAPMIIGR